MNALACILPALAQSPLVADRYEPGESAHWVVEAQGEPIGHHGSRYAGEVELLGARAHRFEGQVVLRAELPQGELLQRYTGELWTDAAGWPLRFELRAAVGESVSGVELAFEPDEVRALVRQGPTPRELTVPLEEPVRILANNFISHVELMLALTPPPEEGAAERRVFSPNVLKALPITFERKGAFEEAWGAGDIVQDSLGERILLTADGRIHELHAGAVVFRRVDEPYEPFRIELPEREPEPRDDLAEEDVRIETGEAVLAGTLSRPAGAEGRLPAVFFVSGSGPQDRDGYSSGIDVGTHELLDHLARAGFLVLRVDDRGTGQSTGRLPGLTFGDLVGDARACADFLLAHEGADPERVFAIGHSEGAGIVPVLAAERPQLAGIVLMAPPGRSVIEVIYEQNEHALRAEGDMSEEEIAESSRELRREMERFCSEAELSPEELPEEFRALLPNRAWFQSHARQDPVANIREVRCPVLIVHGALDFQVSPERDAQPLEDALAAIGHPDHELHVLPGLDHLFKRAPAGESRLADYFLDRRVDPGFLDLVTTWLRERARLGG